MPRHPTPLSPDDGPLAGFAIELRELRDRMGPTAPGVDQISVRQRIPRSTLYAALRGKRVPTRDVLAALVSSWGGDVQVWMRKRAAVVQQVTAGRMSRAASKNGRELPNQVRRLSDRIARYLEK